MRYGLFGAQDFPSTLFHRVSGSAADLDKDFSKFKIAFVAPSCACFCTALTTLVWMNFFHCKTHAMGVESSVWCIMLFDKVSVNPP